MSTKRAKKFPALTINQRNLYNYYLSHRKKYENAECFVPKCPSQNSSLDQYFKALAKLEKYGLIRVDRTSKNYTGWKMLPPQTFV